MTTSAAPTTTDQLRDQLDAARDQVTAAERELGSAALDGKGVERRSDALDQAQAEVRRLELAIGEAERRATEAETQAADDARRQDRVDLYRSVIGWLPRVEVYTRARVALDEAEAALKANPPHPTVCAIKGNTITWLDPRVADLDKRAVSKLPKVPREGSTVPMPDPERFTPEYIADLMARATELAEAEERGESIAVTPAEERERSARRRRIEIAEGRRNG